MRRPASVTVVAVLLILSAIAGLAGIVLGALNPSHDVVAAELQHRIDALPPRVATGIAVAVSLIDFVAGLLLLRRRILGRTLYAVVGALTLVETAVTVRGVALPAVAVSLLIYAVFIFLLFRSPSTRWLRHRHG